MSFWFLSIAHAFTCKALPFYLLEQIRILNHISISPPSLISNIYSHLSTLCAVCLSLLLSPPVHPANSPGDSAGEILMCSVKCCCLECCPDHELCFWTGVKKRLAAIQRLGQKVHAVAHKTPSGSTLYPPVLCTMQMIHDCNVKLSWGNSELPQ